MKHLTVIFTSLFLITFSKTSPAGIADLSFDAEFDGIENGVTFQQQGTFRVTVTNNGPDAAGLGSGTGIPIAIFSGFVELSPVDGTEMEYNIDSSIAQSCQFGLIAVDPRPGNPPGFTFFFRTAPIPANESVTCHGLYLVNFTEGVRTYNWRVSGFVGDTDPDFTNNFEPVTFGIRPIQVPTLNFLGLVVLTLGGLCFGYKTIHLRTSM